MMRRYDQISIEEKIALLVGVGVPKKVPGTAGETREISGIPSIELSDGPSGLRVEPYAERVYLSTAFPSPIMLASTWDPEIVEEVGRAIGEEARENGIDILLGPGLNIHRHPLCGRNFEYFSEDPLLSGVMASAYVKGVQSAGVGATPKHFVANDQETNRYFIDTIVSERALREIYLKPFEIVVKKASPWAIMSSYNKLNGRYTSQDPWLLIDVLRKEWGFEGIVMTDWGAGDDPVEQINSGIDLIMPGDDKIYEKLVSAYREGRLKPERVEESFNRLLKIFEKTLSFRGYKPSYRPDLEKNAEIAYKAGLEGAVLLKNIGETLPLKTGSRVAIFGVGQIATLKSGMGSGHNHSRYTINIVEGLRKAGFKIDEELFERYHKYVVENYGLDNLEKLYKDEIYPKKLNEDFIEEDFIKKTAERNDVALIVITRISGEAWDRSVAGGDFYLSLDEKKLIEKVSKAFRSVGKKVVAILNIAGPIEIYSWRDLVDAILLIWLPGQEAGRIVADLLIGKISPSGKLPITFPKSWTDVPVSISSECYPGTPPENPVKVRYCEDIYVGYRYYDTFGVEPAYEFGYGLSYTSFEYSGLDMKIDKDNIILNIKIRNIGRYPGREVVQVYIKAPGEEIDRPEQELKAFKKTKMLRPGEEEEIKIEISIKDLATYHPEKKRWIVERGWHEIRIGSSSRDIRLTGKIYIPEEIVF
jgi:beta-glucosidase